MSTSTFLSEFPPVSTEAWEQAIHEDLKGADYAEKLIWQTPEGIDVKPYYRGEDLARIGISRGRSREFPYVRGTRSTGGWRIREEIDAVDPEEANAAARCALPPARRRFHFAGRDSELFRPWHPACKPGRGSRSFPECGSSHRRPAHRAARETAACRSHLNRPRWRAPTLMCRRTCLQDLPRRSCLSRSIVEDLQDNGATAVDEVGFALGAGVDFLAGMNERGLAADRVADSVTFSFAIGPDFFMQIAKLRAFRMVWAQALETFGATREHAKARVYARTARWNQTIYDPHVNMLRGTTEAIAAIIGGADSLCVAPFDACYKEPDEFSRRLARNTQLILKQEAFLARVADPGGGSYFLERLTDAIASKAWKLLQEIEAAGGYRKANEAGVIARTLEERRAARDKAVTSRRRVLTGTNRFADASERALDRIESRISRARAAPRNRSNNFGCGPNAMRSRQARRRVCCWRNSAMRRCAARVRLSPPISSRAPASTSYRAL